MMVRKAKFSHVLPIFNLIVEGSAYGYFNNLYAFPRYQLGLAKQLLLVWMLGKICLPDNRWYKATLYVICHQGAFVGFTLLRYQISSGAHQEIYLCGVERMCRGKGYGKHLIRTLLDRLPENTIIEAECLPQSESMKCLLRGLGFKAVNATETVTVKDAAEKFSFRTPYPVHREG